VAFRNEYNNSERRKQANEAKSVEVLKKMNPLVSPLKIRQERRKSLIQIPSSI
jgi:hypothetical protein